MATGHQEAGDEQARLHFAQAERSIEPAPAQGKKPPSVLSHIVSGICGSLFAEQVLFPLDTIKVRSQTSAAGQSGSFLAVGLRVFQGEGILGFYKGLSGALFKESFHSANFWIWHTLIVRKAVLRKEAASSMLWKNFICKVLNWLCTTPLEVLSTLNQTTPGNLGLYGCAVMLYNQGGLGELYRGLPISCALAINPAIMFVLIEEQKKLITFLRMRMGEDGPSARQHGPLAMFWTTAIAKIIATIFTYPFIRAKVLIQVRGGGLLSVPSVLRQIVSEEGYGGLFKGIVAMTWKTVLHNALMMALKHHLSPLKAMTPPPSPRSKAREPAATPFRAVVPVEVMAEKLDQVMDTFGTASLEKFQNIEHRTHAVEGSINKVQSEIRSLSSDMQQIKQLLVAMSDKKNTS
jgi:adenine nucleotide transporter 17